MNENGHLDGNFGDGRQYFSHNLAFKVRTPKIVTFFKVKNFYF